MSLAAAIESIKRAVRPVPEPPSAFEMPKNAVTDRKLVKQWDRLTTNEVHLVRAACLDALDNLGRVEMFGQLEPRCALVGGVPHLVLSAPLFSTPEDAARAGRPFTTETMIALPMAEGVALYLSPASPEKVLEHRRRKREDAQREARERERREMAARDAAAEEAARQAQRLTAWRAIPRLERCLLQLAKAHPEERAFRLLVDALAKEPVQPNEVPEGF